jgi:hypothetical protein
MSTRNGLLACTLLVAALAAGCGAGSTPGSQLDCLRDAENAAATPLVARLYASGKLGSPGTFKARYFPKVDRSAYLDAQGRLKPWNGVEEGPARDDLGNSSIYTSDSLPSTGSRSKRRMPARAGNSSATDSRVRRPHHPDRHGGPVLLTPPISRVACASLVVAAMATGCGSNHVDPGKRVACLLDAENAAATPAVARFYEQGRLGSPASVKARYFPDVPRGAYLDAKGQLKPWTSMQERARADLIYNHVRLSPRYGATIEAAYARGREQSRCS